MSQSVARALQLLIHLGSGPATLDELAAATGVHKTTVLRLRARCPTNGSRSATTAIIITSAHASSISPPAAPTNARFVASPHPTSSCSTASTAAPRTWPPWRGERRLHRQAGVARPDPDVLADWDERQPELHRGGQGDPRRSARRRAATGRRGDGLHPPYAQHDHDPAALPAGDRNGPCPGLGARPRGERAIDQLHRRSGPGASGRVVAAVSVSVPDVVLPYDRVLDLLGPLQAVGERISRKTAVIGRSSESTTTTRQEYDMSDSQVIRTDDAPAPAHTFSQGIRKGGFLRYRGRARWTRPRTPTSARVTCGNRPGARSRTSRRSLPRAVPVSRTC